MRLQNEALPIHNYSVVDGTLYMRLESENGGNSRINRMKNGKPSLPLGAKTDISELRTLAGRSWTNDKERERKEVGEKYWIFKIIWCQYTHRVIAAACCASKLLGSSS